MARRFKLNREEAIYGWLFVFPHVLGLLVFTIGAIFASGYLSLTRWDLFGAPEWVGLDNYRRLADDEIFWRALGNTVYYTGLRVPLSLVFSLAVALLMNLKIRGILWWRVVYFAPAVSSSVAIALVWRWIYSKDFGLLNAFLGHLGVEPLNWLGSETLAMPAVIVMSVWWSVGTNMVIYLAALQGVPEQFYEAAELDGTDEEGVYLEARYLVRAAGLANASVVRELCSRGADPNAATAAAAAWLCASAASEAGSEGRTIDAFSLISDSNASFSRRTEVR